MQVCSCDVIILITYVTGCVLCFNKEPVQVSKQSRFLPLLTPLEFLECLGTSVSNTLYVQYLFKVRVSLSWMQTMICMHIDKNHLDQITHAQQASHPRSLRTAQYAAPETTTNQIRAPHSHPGNQILHAASTFSVWRARSASAFAFARLPLE